MKDDGCIGILRFCQRCHVWRSIDQYAGTARLCRECVRTEPYRRSGYITPARAILLTDKGREAIREDAAVLSA